MSKSMRFDDIAIINPTVGMQKGNKYPCVMMDEVDPNRRYVHGIEHKLFKGGGAKFQSGDVLFARITPSLENGKIAQYTGKDGFYGFGSTEFIVFRSRPGISDPNYLYYLSKTNIIRKPAEKSMFGASGRQRADINVVKEINVPIPPLSIQRKIAVILSAYDNLIENNTRRIHILEEMAQAIYREWFVHFRFPGHEGVRMVDSGTELGEVPEGWEVKKLGEVIELAYGKGLKKNDRASGSIPVYGSSGVIGYHDKHLVNGPGIIVGRKGNVGSVFWSDQDYCPIDTTYFVRSNLSLQYIFYNLQHQNFLNTDAAVPGLSRNQAYSLLIIVPQEHLITKFEEFVTNVFTLTKNLRKKNSILINSRDLLLPKLISGEIEVSDMEVAGMESLNADEIERVLD
jgi:type I restriction enzyme, S subunit